MFACPHCAQTLLAQHISCGVVWVCPVCKGHAASVAVLRKVFGPERVNAVWNEPSTEPGCACPICAGQTVRVTWLEQAQQITLDLCHRCGFVWFDPNEYESLTPIPRKPQPFGAVDPIREKMAMIKVEQLARERDAEIGPPEEWKNIPALFGLPVEMDILPSPRVPIATYLVAALIAVVSFWEFFAIYERKSDVVNQLGLVPSEWTRDGGLTLLTSFFLHGSPIHLLGNLYFLVVFGRHVEIYLGWWRWLVLLGAAALVGDAVDIFFTSDSTLPTIGASGGISGLLAFYALQFPHARLGLLFRYMFQFRWITLSSSTAFWLWILFQFFGAYLQMKHEGNVASLAHLGGVAAGFGAWALWKNLDTRPSPGALQLPGAQVR